MVEKFFAKEENDVWNFTGCVVMGLIVMTDYAITI